MLVYITKGIEKGSSDVHGVVAKGVGVGIPNMQTKRHRECLTPDVYMLVDRVRRQ